MNRNKAEKLLMEHRMAVGDYYLNGTDESKGRIDTVRNQLLAALTGSDRPDTFCAQEVLELFAESLKCYYATYTSEQWGAIRDALKFVESGTWRKVKP